MLFYLPLIKNVSISVSLVTGLSAVKFTLRPTTGGAILKPRMLGIREREL